MSNHPQNSTQETLAMVVAALRALEPGRAPAYARRYQRELMQRHARDATHIAHVLPEDYEALFIAAGGKLPSATKPVADTNAAPPRALSPLEADLRQRLAAGVRNLRPTGRVDYGCNLYSDAKPSTQDAAG